MPYFLANYALVPKPDRAFWGDSLILNHCLGWPSDRSLVARICLAYLVSSLKTSQQALAPKIGHQNAPKKESWIILQSHENFRGYMGVSKYRGVKPPQIIHFNRVFHYKPSILGYHYFWKHPYRGLVRVWVELGHTGEWSLTISVKISGVITRC